MPDEQLCAALSEHLSLDASAAFARPLRAAAKTSAKGAKQEKPPVASLDEFVARMAPLLEMERDAEMAQVTEKVAHLPMQCSGMAY